MVLALKSIGILSLTMIRRSLLVLIPGLLCLPFSIIAADVPKSTFSRSRPDYVKLYQQILVNFPRDRKPTLVEFVSMSEAALRIWRTTREETYRKQALGYFDDLLNDPRFDLKDFHVLQGFGRLTVLLQEEKLLRPDHEMKLKALADQQLRSFCKSSDNSDNNIRLAQVLGYACLMKYQKGESYPLREAAQKRLNDYWNLIRETGDLDEDASNYDSLGLVFLIDLVSVMGWEEHLQQSAKFRRLFERFRDIVSPSGLIPEYGDSYFAYLGRPLDRIFILEYAAKLYNDPTYLHVARQLFARPEGALPNVDSWLRALPLIDMPLSGAEPKAPTGDASLVMFRQRRDNHRPLVDKLILRTGREAGAAMIMLDLYAAGSHAHPEKGPSVAFYEVDHVPLFHNLGRHRTRSAITGNLPWALPAVERFPGCWNRENAWFTMTIPVTYLDQQDGRPFMAPVMSLRNFQEHNRACKYLFFDNLRLEGPAGVRLVDEFEDSTRWDATVRKLGGVVLSDDRTQGKASERVAWKALPSTHLNRKLTGRPEAPFRPTDYAYLKLDVKYVGARPYMHIRGLGKQVDLGDQILTAEISGAKAEQHGQDAYGCVEYSSYRTSDTKLTRHFVLTAEGYLVVQDVLTPGKSMGGWEAGQLWQFYEKQAMGQDWFCSQDDGPYPTATGGTTWTRRMLVRYDTDPATTIGIEEIPQGYHNPCPCGRKSMHFWTTYSKRKVVPGARELFTLAVLPHDPQEAGPMAMARRIGFRSLNDQTHVTIQGKPRQRTVEITIGARCWEVQR